MKKAFLFFAGALLLAGCAKETETKEETGVKTYTITASVDNLGTRSTADVNETGEVSFSWGENERIAVIPVANSTVLPFIVANADDGTFSYTPMPDEDEYESFIMAVSPANALDPEVIVDGSWAMYNIIYSGDYVQEQSNAIMVAGTPTTGSDGTQHFQFRHIGGLVKVSYTNVPAGTKAMVFSTQDNPITGVFEFEEIANIEAKATSIGGTTGNEATVRFTTAPTSEGPADFYLPIPTGSYQTFTVKLIGADDNDIDGSEQTFTAPSAFTVKPADVILCPEVTITSTPQLVVENFNSSGASSNKYGCSSNLSTPDVVAGFDFVWTSSGSGTAFQNGIKLGAGSSTGSVTSSNILSRFSAGNNFTVKVYAALWGTDNGQLKVTYNGIDLLGDPTSSIESPNDKEYSASHFGAPTEFVFTKIANVESLTIASTSKRIIIDKIEIVSGGTVPAIESLTITPSTDNPVTVPSGGGVMHYTVTATNIDSWDVSSDKPTTFVPEKTTTGFKVTVAENTNTSARSATITVSGGSKTETVTIYQAAAEGDDPLPDPTSFIIAQSSIPFSGSGYQTYTNIDINGFKFDLTNIMKSGTTDIQLRANNGAINNTTPIGRKIVSISFTSVTNSVTVYASTDKSTYSAVTGTNGTYTFTGDEQYFKISAGSSYAVIGAITITYIPSSGGDQPEDDTQTVTFTPGTDTGATSVTKSGITITMSTMANSDYYQIYANASMTVESASCTIKGITFTCTASGTSKYGPGNASASVGTYSYSGNTGTWVGSNPSVTISSTAQVRMTSLTITYVENN